MKVKIVEMTNLWWVRFQNVLIYSGALWFFLSFFAINITGRGYMLMIAATLELAAVMRIDNREKRIKATLNKSTNIIDQAL